MLWVNLLDRAAARAVLLLGCLSACGDTAPSQMSKVTDPTWSADPDASTEDDTTNPLPSNPGDGDGAHNPSDSGIENPLGTESGVRVPGSALPPGKDYSGWTWVETKGSKCRDGSPAGYYHRLGKIKSLVIFLNGGGACADRFFCGLNP